MLEALAFVLKNMEFILTSGSQNLQQKCHSCAKTWKLGLIMSSRPTKSQLFF